MWLFIASRIAIFAFQALTVSAGGRAASVPWFEPWLRWDAMYYTSIAEYGYTFSTEVFSSAAFFPLYPMLIKLVSFLTGNADSAALIVSNAALLGALIAIHALASLDHGYERAGRRAALYLILYPSAFFMSAAYTESLFLLTTIGAVYFARTQRWTLAIVLGMFAAVTRMVGGLVWGVILLEWAASHGFTLTQLHRREAWQALGRGLRQQGWVVAASLAIPLMLGSFMLYQYNTFGSFTAFSEALYPWRGEIVFNRFIIEFVAVVTGETRLFHLVLGSIALIFVIPFIPLAFRLRGSYGWYILLAAAVPLLGGLYSYIRYVGGIFPVFIVLAGLPLSPRYERLVLIIFGLFQILLLFLYLNGEFLA